MSEKQLKIRTSVRFQKSDIIKYAVLGLWSLIVLLPFWTMIINSIKPQLDIFRDPFGFPTTFNFDSYINVFTSSNYLIIFKNSIVVTLSSLFLIVLLGSLAAFGLAYWKRRVSFVLYIFFIAGLMIPIRLGTINILQILKSMNLIDQSVGLIPIYVAMGLPFAIFVLTEFIRELPYDIVEASIIDGAGRWTIFFKIIFPLIKPAISSVVIYNMVNIWNDLWFPLILIRSENQQTLMLGVSYLFGQYQTDWSKILAVLLLSSLPLILLYIFLSKQFIKGLTAGAVKG